MIFSAIINFINLYITYILLNNMGVQFLQNILKNLIYHYMI